MLTPFQSCRRRHDITPRRRYEHYCLYAPLMPLMLTPPPLPHTPLIFRRYADAATPLCRCRDARVFYYITPAATFRCYAAAAYFAMRMPFTYAMLCHSRYSAFMPPIATLPR